MENEKKDYSKDLTKENTELTEDALDQVAGGWGFSSIKKAVKNAVPMPQDVTEAIDSPLTVHAIIDDPVISINDIIGGPVGGPIGGPIGGGGPLPGSAGGVIGAPIGKVR